MLDMQSLTERLTRRPKPWLAEHSTLLPREPHDRKLAQDRITNQGDLARALEGRWQLLDREPPNETLYADKSPVGFRPVKPIDLVSRTFLNYLVAQALPGYQTAAEAYESFEQFDRSPISDSDPAFIVVADVSHFYDYIPHDLLGRELLLQGSERRTVQALLMVLEKIMDRQVGLPQTYPSSHVLGDIYISIATRRLVRWGYKVWRYTDDFRIECDGFGDATRALELLNVELRSLGLALNDRKSLRYSRDRYERRLHVRSTAWNDLMRAIGGLGGWATESSPYGDPYDDDLRTVSDTAEEISDAHQVIDFFDQYFSSNQQPDEMPGRELAARLINRAFGILIAAEEPSEVRIDNWIRVLPSLTPRIFRAMGLAEEEQRERMSEDLARALGQGEVHLNAWQESWLAWLYREELGVSLRLVPHFREVAETSLSSFARAHALSSLLAAQGGEEDLVNAVSKEFDRANPASREVLAHAVTTVGGPRMEELRSTIGQEEQLYRMLVNL